MARANVSLESLSQAQASWLIQNPTVWLRDNAHLILRNSDNTYDARELVNAIKKHASTEIPPLSSADAERAAIVADRLTTEIGYDAHDIVNFAADIQRRYGAAGLAAIMQAIVAECVALAGLVGTRQLETEATIRGRNERQLTNQLEWRNRTLFEQNVICSKCGKVRRGDTWSTEPPVNNWVTIKSICSGCSAKQ